MMSNTTAERTLRSILTELEVLSDRLSSIEAKIEPPQGYMTKAAAGRYLGRSRSCVSDLCARGVLPTTKTGLIRFDDLVKYAEEGPQDDGHD